MDKILLLIQLLKNRIVSKVVYVGLIVLMLISCKKEQQKNYVIENPFKLKNTEVEAIDSLKYKYSVTLLVSDINATIDGHGFIVKRFSPPEPGEIDYVTIEEDEDYYTTVHDNGCCVIAGVFIQESVLEPNWWYQITPFVYNATFIDYGETIQFHVN